MRKHEGNKTTDRGSQRGEHRRSLKDTWGHEKSKHETQQDMKNQNMRHNKTWKIKTWDTTRHDIKTWIKYKNQKPDTRTNTNRNHDT